MTLTLRKADRNWRNVRMTPEEIRLHAEQRKRLSGSYKRAFEEISAILFRHDPIGISCGENTDEYDPEAGTIISRLRSEMSVDEAASVVHDEFVRWFSHADAGPRGGYVVIAAEVLSAFRRAELR